jgi:hypothetical protein
MTRPRVSFHIRAGDHDQPHGSSFSRDQVHERLAIGNVDLAFLDVAAVGPVLLLEDEAGPLLVPADSYEVGVDDLRITEGWPEANVAALQFLHGLS